MPGRFSFINLHSTSTLRYTQNPRKASKDDDVLSLFETKLLTCGPGLWRDIKKDGALSKLDGGKAVFNLPVRGADGSIVRTDKLEGKIFQSPAEVLAFWKAFKQRTDFTDLKIRKLNQEELKIFWAMIPFDITEPIFVLDSKKHKILVVFTSPEKLKIMWIDDYQDIRFRDQTSSKKPEAGDGK
jgi:hypothetical protein